jgi:hypothetical protein
MNYVGEIEEYDKKPSKKSLSLRKRHFGMSIELRSSKEKTFFYYRILLNTSMMDLSLPELC